MNVEDDLRALRHSLTLVTDPDDFVTVPASRLRAILEDLEPRPYRLYVVGDRPTVCMAGMRMLPDGSGPFPTVSLCREGTVNGFGLAFVSVDALEAFRRLLDDDALRKDQ